MSEVCFEGKVVGILIKDGRRVAKILIGPHVVEVDAEHMPEPRLGDQVRLDAGLITLAASTGGKHA
jgi:hypothetical protein